LSEAIFQQSPRCSTDGGWRIYATATSIFVERFWKRIDAHAPSE